MKPMPEERDKTTEEPQVLDLVAPWNLPLALDLGDREREAVAATLTELDAELASEQPRSQALEKLIERFPTPTVQRHSITDTKSNLTSEDVESYDRYFEVRHVDTESPALSIVRSLLMTCHSFLSLRETGFSFDSEQVALQTTGFREHARLIARICGIALAP